MAAERGNIPVAELIRSNMKHRPPCRLGAAHVYPWRVLAKLRQLAEAAAALATAQLELMAFGAIDEILVAGVEAGQDEGLGYFTVSWSVVSMGMEDSRVSMVILPEFLDEGDPDDDLAVQMAAYVVDKVLTGVQDD
jgi:hypothetical protein